MQWHGRCGQISPHQARALCGYEREAWPGRLAARERALVGTGAFASKHTSTGNVID